MKPCGYTTDPGRSCGREAGHHGEHDPDALFSAERISLLVGPARPCEYACTTTLDHPTPGYCGKPSDGLQPPRCEGHRKLEAKAPPLFMPFIWALVFALIALTLPGCASGPQVVPVTPVTNLTVNVYAYDGGAIRFGELWIDGTSADGQAEAQGLDVDADVDTTIDTNVSAVP